MDNINKLQEIGLTEKEARLYLTALELGQFSVSSIAAKSGLKRPTCYLIIEQLIKRGLVSLIPRSQKALYQAESPEVLLDEADKRKQLAQKLVPGLKSIVSKQRTAPVVTFYTGKRGVENIYNEMLKSPEGGTLYSILNPDKLFGVTGKDFLDEWVKNRVAKNITAESIQPAKSNDIKYYDFGTSDKFLRRVRYLPAEVEIPAAIMISADKAGFISSKDDDFSFLVASEEFRKMMKALYDAIEKSITK